MKKDEFMAKIDYKGLTGLFVRTGYGTNILHDAKHNVPSCPGSSSMVLLEGPSITKSDYTQKMLVAINQAIATKYDIIKAFALKCDSALAAYYCSAEYHEKVRIENAKKFAISAGLMHDEHSGYGRGDNHTLDICDIVDNPVTLKQFHAAGKILMLVHDRRERRYAQSYAYGPSTRVDSWLVGENETGSKFTHAVPHGISTVEDAINWIWSQKSIFARHGDIAIVEEPRNVGKSVLGKTESVVAYPLHDNHVFTGELCRYANTDFVRAGKISHLKEQHPDVAVPAEKWYRVLIARRSTRRRSSSD